MYSLESFYSLPALSLTVRAHRRGTSAQRERTMLRKRRLPRTGSLDSQSITSLESSNRSRAPPIVTQNENRPCPLLAIINLLFLARKLLKL